MLHSYSTVLPRLACTAQMSSYNFETLKVETIADHVVSVSLNRPEKRNAMNKTMWLEIGEAFKQLSVDSSCRSIVLSGQKKMFSSGNFNILNNLFNHATKVFFCNYIKLKYSMYMILCKIRRTIFFDLIVICFRYWCEWND